MSQQLFPPTLDEMIAELEREIGLRRRVYPQFIASKRLTQQKGDRQIAVMEAIVANLQQQKAAKE